MSTPDPHDDVDDIAAAWLRERPDLPVRSIGVLTRLRRIAKLLEDDRRRTMAALGMEPAVRDLLSELRRAGPPYRLRVTELAERCHVTKGAVTQRVDRAAADGLVHRTGDDVGDRRAVHVELTPTGHDLLERTVDTLLAHEDSLVAGLGDDAIADLSDTLRRFLRQLDDRHGDGSTAMSESR